MRRSAALIGAPPSGAVRAVAVLLPGGSIRSRRRPLRLAEWGVSPLRHRLQEHRDDGLASYLLHYRYRGWYAGSESAATEADTRWALGEIAERHPGAPVVLIGNSLGGRAAVATADHPAVTAVAGVAPWLPPEQGIATLTGRRLLIVHGSADRSDAPALWSLAFAERARNAGIPTGRFIVPGDGHFLLRRQRDWVAAVTAFTLAATGLASMPPLLARAFRPETGVAVPLPVAEASAAPTAGRTGRAAPA